MFKHMVAAGSHHHQARPRFKILKTVPRRSGLVGLRLTLHPSHKISYRVRRRPRSDENGSLAEPLLPSGLDGLFQLFGQSQERSDLSSDRIDWLGELAFCQLPRSRSQA